jgi:hypothetical protein
MNPILFYPQNVAQADFLRKTAESKGLEEIRVSRKIWETIDDMLFAERMKANRTGKYVSEDEFKKLVEQKLAE